MVLRVTGWPPVLVVCEDVGRQRQAAVEWVLDVLDMSCARASLTDSTSEKAAFLASYCPAEALATVHTVPLARYWTHGSTIRG